MQENIIRRVKIQFPGGTILENFPLKASSDQEISKF